MKMYLLLLMALLFGIPELPAQTSSEFVEREAHLAPGLLNSERIRMKFGSYGISVLKEDIHHRISNLYSDHTGERITRTIALVIYEEIDQDSPVYYEHGEVVAGGSIGEVFKRNGWEVLKTHHDITTMGGCLPSSQAVIHWMKISERDPIAVHSYVFSVRKNAEIIPYAQIIEIHHPDFLSFEDLQKIVPAEATSTKAEEAYLRELLAEFFELLDDTFGRILPERH